MININNIPKELLTYIFLFILCSIFFILSIKNRENNFISVIPNVISMFVLGPIFLIVGYFNTKYNILYLILSIIALGLFLSIMYELIQEDKSITIGRLFYLLLFIPILIYIGFKRENSSVIANNLLFVIGIFYIIYNTIAVCFPKISKNSIFNGFPEHPLKRLLPLLQK